MTARKTPETIAAEAARKDRLGRALRENLKRRKVQGRSRNDKPSPDREPEPPQED